MGCLASGYCLLMISLIAAIFFQYRFNIAWLLPPFIISSSNVLASYWPSFTAHSLIHTPPLYTIPITLPINIFFVNGYCLHYWDQLACFISRSSPPSLPLPSLNLLISPMLFFFCLFTRLFTTLPDHFFTPTNTPIASFTITLVTVTICRHTITHWLILLTPSMAFHYTQRHQY